VDREAGSGYLWRSGAVEWRRRRGGGGGRHWRGPEWRPWAAAAAAAKILELLIGEVWGRGSGSERGGVGASGRIKNQVEAHGARFPEEDSFAYNPLDFVLFFKNLGVHFSCPCLAGIYRHL
jgi:hypothetical protein